MGDRTPIALDHNFPQSILEHVPVPEFDFVWIKDLELNELEDHHLIYELGRRHFPLMVTHDYRMLSQVAPVQAIVEVGLTVVALRRSGDDPIFATGVLLRDLRDVLKADRRVGQFVIVSPARVKLEKAEPHLRKLRLEQTGSGASSGRARQAFERYPDGDPRRVR